VSCFAVANVTHHPISHNYFDAFFYYFFYNIQKTLAIKYIDSNKIKTIFQKENQQLKIYILYKKE